MLSRHKKIRRKQRLRRIDVFALSAYALFIAPFTASVVIVVKEFVLPALEKSVNE